MFINFYLKAKLSKMYRNKAGHLIKIMQSTGLLYSVIFSMPYPITLTLSEERGILRIYFREGQQVVHQGIDAIGFNYNTQSLFSLLLIHKVAGVCHCRYCYMAFFTTCCPFSDS
jgi:hypothetical protein